MWQLQMRAGHVLRQRPEDLQVDATGNDTDRLCIGQIGPHMVTDNNQRIRPGSDKARDAAQDLLVAEARIADAGSGTQYVRAMKRHNKWQPPGQGQKPALPKVGVDQIETSPVQQRPGKNPRLQIIEWVLSAVRVEDLYVHARPAQELCLTFDEIAGVRLSTNRPFARYQQDSHPRHTLDHSRAVIAGAGAWQ